MSQAIVHTHQVKDIPKDMQSPAYRLFHYYYRVWVQQLFTIDAGIAGEWGTSTSGDPKLDKEMRSAWVEVQHTPVEMVQLLQRGAALEFTDVHQATAIYLDILAHLRLWVKAFETNPNLRRAPLEDLRLFDDLAGQLYPYASHTLMAGEEDAGYGAFLARTARRRGNTTILRGLAPAPGKGPSRGTYRPLSDTVAELLAKRVG